MPKIQTKMYKIKKPEKGRKTHLFGLGSIKGGGGNSVCSLRFQTVEKLTADPPNPHQQTEIRI
jgi:hypothetical protein